MEKLRAILVDDEEGARNVLANLLQRFCPQVELIDRCEDLPQAVASIQRHQPDLVFLDIEMPRYAGYEIGQFFPEINFAIIFVTAYDSYAVRAFEMAAVDYLLKPVDIDRLRVAVARAAVQVDLKQRAERLRMVGEAMQTQEIKNLMVAEKGFQQVVPLESIVAIEAQESYCTIHTRDKKFVVSKNLKHFESLLEHNPAFLRVHKSWMVHKPHILNYSRTDGAINLTGGIVARLSKYKKQEFEQAIQG